jgi:putative transposase
MGDRRSGSAWVQGEDMSGKSQGCSCLRVFGTDRYLLHDRDTKFTQAFDALLKASGVEPIVLPPRSPNLNAHCERFVRSIKEEALDRMVMVGAPALSSVIHQYLAHYHAERNHQGLANQLITPEPGLGSHSGPVRRRERLGGLLRYHYRNAA